MRGGGDIALVRQAVEEVGNLGAAHFARVSPVVVVDEPADPADVRLLGAIAVVPVADAAADFVEKQRRVRAGGRRCGRWRRRGLGAFVPSVHIGTSRVTRRVDVSRNRCLALTLVDYAA